FEIAYYQIFHIFRVHHFNIPMTVKEHYDNHLGNFYSWFTGDFDQNVEKFYGFCRENNIKPENSSVAIDLGAGHGIQTIALAKSGFRVLAVDFNDQLLTELKSRVADFSIDVVSDDIRSI